MTWFANFREQDKRGVVRPDCQLLWAVPPAQPEFGPPVDLAFRNAIAGKRLLFVSHGFNVDQSDGIITAVKLESLMTAVGGTNPPRFPMGSDALFIGVLWPGDWYNVLNYPTEAGDAKLTGQRLGTFINTHCRSAKNVSFASHSLGARVILTAAEHVDPAIDVDKIILTAPAADDDCLVGQHARGFKAASQVHVLSSKRDNTLKFAYPAGDFLSDIFGDGDNPFHGALGYRGPRPGKLSGMIPRAIAGKPYGPGQAGSDFDHCHYFPPADATGSLKKPTTVAHYIAAAFADGDYWP